MRTLPRGTVTLLFTDIEGSPPLFEDLGEERFNETLVEHRRIPQEAFQDHDGVELLTEGGSFFAAFARAARLRPPPPTAARCCSRRRPRTCSRRASR